MKNPNPKPMWATGDICFYYEHWSGTIASGTVAALHGGLADVRGTNGPGCTNKPLDELFPDQRSAMDALRDMSLSIQEGYEKEITDVPSLVRFAYDHCVSSAEEYTDWEARRAYEKRAREQLGIDLAPSARKGT